MPLIHPFQEYRLIYTVFDEKDTNSATVVVQVMDVNDNPPKFDSVVYNVTDLVEEERSISRQHPKFLLQVGIGIPAACLSWPG